jgi:glycosyltransferase involved in cell wall biosynthesis
MDKKKILYINQYFRKPTEPGITRSYWITQKLIEEGYEVTMLAHRNTLLEHVQGIVPRFEIVDVDGIRVIYLRNQYSNEMCTCARAWAFLSFMFRSIWWTLKEKDVDLVIATSTPLTVAVPALFRKWLRNTPFIFEVRDLWPEVPIQMGAIKNKVAVKFLRWFEKLTYRNACHVIALSPGMQEGVEKYIPHERTSMIPNMAKIDKFWRREKNLTLLRELGLRGDTFKVIYFGQMGLSNAMREVIATVGEVLSPTDDVEFLFLGHGRFKAKVEEKFSDDNRVHVFERVPMERMSEIVNLCDVSLVTFTDLPILYTNSPNKLFDSLSAGIPVIVNSAGWTKEMVETHKCGVFADPATKGSMVAAILGLKDDPELCRHLGENARNLAESHYDKSILCDQFAQVVNRLMRT